MLSTSKMAFEGVMIFLNFVLVFLQLNGFVDKYSSSQVDAG